MTETEIVQNVLKLLEVTAENAKKIQELEANFNSVQYKLTMVLSQLDTIRNAIPPTNAVSKSPLDP